MVNKLMNKWHEERVPIQGRAHQADSAPLRHQQLAASIALDDDLKILPASVAGLKHGAVADRPG